MTRRRSESLEVVAVPQTGTERPLQLAASFNTHRAGVPSPTTASRAESRIAALRGNGPQAKVWPEHLQHGLNLEHGRSQGDGLTLVRRQLPGQFGCSSCNVDGLFRGISALGIPPK